jgi:hypothetical protein
MNKYVVRTSLVWMAVLAVLAGTWIYHSHSTNQPHAMNMPMPGDVQPVAAGPTADTAKPASSMPGMSMPESKTNSSVMISARQARWTLMNV